MHRFVWLRWPGFQVDDAAGGSLQRADSCFHAIEKGMALRRGIHAVMQPMPFKSPFHLECGHQADRLALLETN